eukprot:scaffold14441_cov83-Skeletonema_dohrnii-CCMP3373.AAC.3
MSREPEIRSILRISMHQVKDERITTEEELWKHFHHIPHAVNALLSTSDADCIRYVDNPRPRGRPIAIAAKSFYD